jgi:hypothetical protein
MSDFKLDRTGFKAQAAAESANYKGYYQQFTWQERLQGTNYLNSVAYNYPENDPPKMDKTAFSISPREK